MSGLLSNAQRWHAKKRIIKLLVPYILWTLVYSILNSYQSIRLLPQKFLIGLLTASSAAVMYYVFVYMQLTLLIPAIGKLASSKFYLLGFLISPLEILIMKTIPSLAGRPFDKWLTMIIDVSCLGWFTYFYLGYILGNGLIKLKKYSTNIYIYTLAIGLVWQFAEGYFYYYRGIINCGTQQKLSSVFCGYIICIIAYKYLMSEGHKGLRILKVLGDLSFGIFFAHLAVIKVLNQMPKYANLIIFPFNAFVVIVITVLGIDVCKKVLGKYSRYLAF